MAQQRQPGKSPFFCAAALSALLLTACVVPEPRTVYPPVPAYPGSEPRPELSRPDLVQPALNTITTRIRSYEERLNEVRQIENSPSSMMIPSAQMEQLALCKSQLLDILTGYDSLHKKLLAETNMDRAQNMANTALQRVNQQDMQFLEGKCNRLIADLQNGDYQPASPIEPPGEQSPTPIQPDSDQPLVAPAHAAPDAQIAEAFAAGDYPRVISRYHREWTGVQRPAPATTLQYGQALLKNYQFDEAGRVLAELDAELAPQNDPLEADVVRLRGDLAFGKGDYQAARQHYGKLSSLPGGQNDSWSQRQLAVLEQQNASGEELSAYASLVRSYLAYSPGRDGDMVAAQAERFLQDYPASRLVANVNDIIQKTSGKAPAPPASTEQEEEPGEGQASVQGAQEGQTSAQNAPLSQEQIAAREQTLKEQYERALAQMNSKDYDAALSTLGTLKGTTLEAQALERMKEAASLAGNARREQAAELFVQAMQAQDRTSRLRLLQESKSALQEVLDKYPQAGLESKVQRNLQSVEEELRNLGH